MTESPPPRLLTRFAKTALRVREILELLQRSASAGKRLPKEWIAELAELAAQQYPSFDTPDRLPEAARGNGEPFYVVFDGPPGPNAPTFIEVENAEGRSLTRGKWIERAGGTWALGPFFEVSVSKRRSDSPPLSA